MNEFVAKAPQEFVGFQHVAVAADFSVQRATFAGGDVVNGRPVSCRVEFAGDGTETRLVPATWRPKTYRDEDLTIPAGVPGAPRLQMTTRLTSLGSGRDRIALELVVIYHDDE